MGTKKLSLKMEIEAVKKMIAKYEDKLEALYIKLAQENENETFTEHSFA
ncbi:hypothetical protein [Heyndrickxia camelliae]|nr:hypothetical protein [Heyndrickxia camelliae]